MAGFPMQRLAEQGEAVLQARAVGRWRWLAGRRADLGLEKLYEKDARSLTSDALLDDLRGAEVEDERLRRRLEQLLVLVKIEGGTYADAERTARAVQRARIEEQPWVSARVRWSVQSGEERRRALQGQWLETLERDLNPEMERWLASLTQTAQGVLGEEWLARLAAFEGWSLDDAEKLAEWLLNESAGAYAQGMAAYLGQHGLGLDDAWEADADWALRDPSHDATFPHPDLMPSVVRLLRGLGLEIQAKDALRFNLDLTYASRGPKPLPIEIPHDVRIVGRLVGGVQDYRGMLEAVGSGLHLALADPRTSVGDRWLGDPGTTHAYGALLGSTVFESTWLRNRDDVDRPMDLRIIGYLEWLYRVRRDAALVGYLRVMVQGGLSASALGAEYAERLTAATRVRHLEAARLTPLLDAPWALLEPARRLRGEVFAAQIRAYLRKEFDEEWFRSARAGRFLVDELWRPGRRHDMATLLGHMSYAGLDPSVLWTEIAEVLRTV